MKLTRPWFFILCAVLSAVPLSCGKPPVPAEAPSDGRSGTPSPSDPLPAAASDPAPPESSLQPPAPNPFGSTQARTTFQTRLIDGDMGGIEDYPGAIEEWAASIRADAEIDSAITRLEAAAREPAAPPHVSFALAALYGRKGLISKQYAALTQAETAAAARPDLVFALTAVHGRKELLKSKYTEDELMPASIEISSIPTGANVYLDGIDMGIAPLVLGPLKRGSHSVKLQYERYHGFEKTFNLGLGETITLPVSLQPIPGSIRVTTDPPATVHVQELNIQKPSPAIFEGLSPGKYNVQVLDILSGRRYIGLESPLVVELEPASQISLSPKLIGGKGAIALSHLPEGVRFYLDGQERVIEERISVDAGQYDVELRGGGGALWRGAADVKRNSIGFVDAAGFMYELPRRSISIDGKIGDWGDLSPVLIDSTSDDRMPKRAGTNIQSCYLCRDDKNIYVRVEYADGTPEWFRGVGRGVNLHQGGKRLGILSVIYTDEGAVVANIHYDTTNDGEDLGSHRNTPSGYEASYPLSRLPSGLQRDKPIEAFFYVNTFKIDQNASTDSCSGAQILIGK